MMLSMMRMLLAPIEPAGGVACAKDQHSEPRSHRTATAAHRLRLVSGCFVQDLSHVTHEQMCRRLWRISAECVKLLHVLFRSPSAPEADCLGPTAGDPLRCRCHLGCGLRDEDQCQPFLVDITSIIGVGSKCSPDEGIPHLTSRSASVPPELDWPFVAWLLLRAQEMVFERAFGFDFPRLAHPFPFF